MWEKFELPNIAEQRIDDNVLQKEKKKKKKKKNGNHNPLSCFTVIVFERSAAEGRIGQRTTEGPDC
jgi:hypothetical protein